MQVLQSSDMNDKKEITGMSILSCIETILSVNDEQPQTLEALEPIVLQVIGNIFNTPETGIGKYILYPIYFVSRLIIIFFF